MTPTTPVFASPVCVSMPHFFSDSTTSAEVRLSSEGELGMGVDVAPDVAQLGVVAADPVDGAGHGVWMRSRGSTA